MTRVILFAIPSERAEAVESLLDQLEARFCDPTAKVGQIDEARRTAFTAVQAQSYGAHAVPVEAWEAFVELAPEWSRELRGHLISPASYKALANLHAPPTPLTEFFSQAAESGMRVIQFTVSDDDSWALLHGRTPHG